MSYFKAYNFFIRFNRYTVDKFFQTNEGGCNASIGDWCDWDVGKCGF